MRMVSNRFPVPQFSLVRKGNRNKTLNQSCYSTNWRYCFPVSKKDPQKQRNEIHQIRVKGRNLTLEEEQARKKLVLWLDSPVLWDSWRVLQARVYLKSGKVRGKLKGWEYLELFQTDNSNIACCFLQEKLKCFLAFKFSNISVLLSRNWSLNGKSQYKMLLSVPHLLKRKKCLSKTSPLEFSDLSELLVETVQLTFKFCYYLPVIKQIGTNRNRGREAM